MALARLPIWSESRVALEHAALLRDPVLRGDGVVRGDGAPVLLVPGFLAGDPSLRVMAGWLRRMGYAPCRARIRANVDCTGRALKRLETRLEAPPQRHGPAGTPAGPSPGRAMGRHPGVRR